MTAKSIIDVEINDENFKKYVEYFNKYRETLKSVPSMWSSVGKAASGAAEAHAAIAAALLAQNELLHKLGREETRQQKERDKQQRKDKEDLKRKQQAEQGALARQKRMVKGAKDLAAETGRATLSMAKWAAHSALDGAGLAAALIGGSVFGIDRLADTVAAGRRTSLGLGTKTGELKAARVAFSRFTDPDVALQNIADAQSDWSKRWAFNSMGINPKGRDPADLMGDVLSKAKTMWDHSDHSVQYAHATGLDQIFDINTLRALGNMSQEELEQQKTKFRQEAKQFDLDDKLQRKWQDLSTQLQASKVQIESVFIRGLEPLARVLPKLSQSVADVTEQFLSSEGFKEFVAGLGDRIKDFSAYLGSPEFKTSLSQFMDGVQLVGEEVYEVAKRLKWLLPQPSSPRAPGNGTTAGDGKHYGAAPEDTSRGFASYGTIGEGPGPDYSNPGNIKGPGGGFLRFATRSEGLIAMGKQLQRYEALDKWGHADTISKIVSLYAPERDAKGRKINDTQAYIQDVEKRTGWNRDQHLDLNDLKILSVLERAMLKHENWRNNETVAYLATTLNPTPGRERKQTTASYVGPLQDATKNPFDPYGIGRLLEKGMQKSVGLSTSRKVDIVVNNNTGGSAVVSTNQMR